MCVGEKRGSGWTVKYSEEDLLTPPNPNLVATLERMLYNGELERRIEEIVTQSVERAFARRIRALRENRSMSIHAPRGDFTVLLDELVARDKLENESMKKYFEDKVAMCERCGITGERAVSCVIRGLPFELRATAYSLDCRSPEDLYDQYLSKVEEAYRARSLRRSARAKRVALLVKPTSTPPKRTNTTQPGRG